MREVAVDNVIILYLYTLIYPFLGILTNKTQQNGTSMQYQKGGNSTKLKCSEHSF